MGAARFSPASQPCNSHPLDPESWQYVRNRGAHDRQLVQVLVPVEMRDSDARIAQHCYLGGDFRLEL